MHSFSNLAGLVDADESWNLVRAVAGFDRDDAQVMDNLKMHGLTRDHVPTVFGGDVVLNS